MREFSSLLQPVPLQDSTSAHSLTQPSCTHQHRCTTEQDSGAGGCTACSPEVSTMRPTSFPTCNATSSFSLGLSMRVHTPVCNMPVT